MKMEDFFPPNQLARFSKALYREIDMTLPSMHISFKESKRISNNQTLNVPCGVFNHHKEMSVSLFYLCNDMLLTCHYIHKNIKATLFDIWQMLAKLLNG